MAMSSPGGRSAVRAEPNVTPMIDVMLVLLIIFMLIVPNISAGFQATPPSGSNLKPHPEDQKDQILGIDANGQYYLNRKLIDPASLGPLLKAIYDNRIEDKILYIKADKSLDYGKIIDVFDIASRSGVVKSAMITDQRPGTTSKIPTDNIDLFPGQQLPGNDGGTQ